jgi:hypothetical protein
MNDPTMPPARFPARDALEAVYALVLALKSRPGLYATLDAEGLRKTLQLLAALALEEALRT